MMGEIKSGVFPFQTPINVRSAKQRVKQRYGAPWTFEEHKLFQLGLEKFGKRPTPPLWQEISNFVGTKTPREVHQHAHEYFVKLLAASKNLVDETVFHEIQTTQWNMHEDEAFEQALDNFGDNFPDRWERIAGTLPGRSVEEVKKYYLKLLFNVGALRNEVEASEPSTSTDLDSITSIPSLLTPIICNNKLAKKSNLQHQSSENDMKMNMSFTSFPSPLNLSSSSIPKLFCDF
mmetsp:Transcript_7586/g.9967  ORF Transcript_7586/g.9967 Transcript_7586/m.9967 type:complete len:233 (+) Transcript_7586:41-739(+)